MPKRPEISLSLKGAAADEEETVKIVSSRSFTETPRTIGALSVGTLGFNNPPGEGGGWIYVSVDSGSDVHACPRNSRNYGIRVEEEDVPRIDDIQGRRIGAGGLRQLFYKMETNKGWTTATSMFIERDVTRYILSAGVLVKNRWKIHMAQKDDEQSYLVTPEGHVIKMFFLQNSIFFKAKILAQTEIRGTYTIGGLDDEARREKEKECEDSETYLICPSPVSFIP